MTSRNKYDIAVLGQGAGAFAAVMKASDLGANTAMIGKNATPGTLLGGTCVNVGCVPSKRLLASGEAYDIHQHFEGIRLSDKKLDLRAVIKSKERLVSKLRHDKYRNVLDYLHNVTLLMNSAVLRSVA